MSRRRLVVSLVLACGVGLGVWLAADLAAARRHAAPAAPPPVPVTADAAKSQDVPALIEALGTVQSIDSVGVQSRVNGPITQLFFSQGDEVQQGQPLFQIDPRPYQAALDQAAGQLQRDQATLAQARTDLARYQRLAAQRSIAQQQAEDQAFLVQQDEGTVKLDLATRDSAALNLSFCRIVAPVAGRTGSLLVDLGNIVSTTAATNLVAIAQVKPIYVAFTVPQERLGEIRRHQAEAPLAVEAYGSNGALLSRGRLSLINNQVDTTTGTVLLEATFANDDEQLWPGTFVSVRLILYLRHQAVTVPASTVMAGPNGTYVYVIQPDDTVSRVEVQVASRQDGLAVIEHGLSAGQRVVTDGQYRLADKAKVQIRPTS